MTISDKLARLIEDSGWSIAEVARRIGREGDQQQLLRWMDRLPPSRPKKENVKLRKDGRPRRERDPFSPDRRDLISLSELFSVDIRWLIDDRLDWEDQLKADNPILADIRRLPMETQLAMLKWHVGQAKPAPQAGSTSNPKEKPPVDPPQKGKGETKRGQSASR